MALVGTISGSNGTSSTAITGTLVIADKSAGFPTIPSDAVLFVSGTLGGNKKVVFGGDHVTSGSTELKGDITLSGSNVFIGGDVSFNNDLIFLDKANDRVGIGVSTPEATLSVLSKGTGNTRGFFGEHFDDTTAFSQFKFIGGRSRGSIGSPSPVQANDTLVSFNARGRTNIGWSDTVGGLYIYAKENWTSTNTPTFFTMRGVAAGAGTAVSEWVRIESTGVNISGSLVLKNESGATTITLSSSGDMTGTGQLIAKGIFNSGTIGNTFTNDMANFNFTTQSFVGVDTGLGAYTGTLPVISGDYIGRMFVIKDVGGFCGTNAFVVTASSPNKIDGATELKVSVSSGSVSLIAGISGSSYNWYIVGSN